MQGKIINVTRYCLHDGKGIRTTVFLKGCPLSCIWCHNPESQNPYPEISFDKKKCASCGACAAVCEKGCHFIENGEHIFKRTDCVSCFRCVEACSRRSLQIEGRTISSEEVVREIEKDKVFYDQSGGGVTLSGGEPLFQPAFTCEIFKLCKEKGINTAIETCGFAKAEVFKECLKYCDYVFFDIKETNEEKHILYTGKPLSPILDNLKILGESGIPFTLRLPIIPGLNDREEHIKKASALAEGYPSYEKTETMPYHELGVYKYELLGRKYLYNNDCGK